MRKCMRVRDGWCVVVRYVDEHGPDLVALGLEWHSKMLLRIEIAGTIINSYDTYQHWCDTPISPPF